MKHSIILSLALSLGQALANIKFTYAPLQCDVEKPFYTGCLDGQDCLQDGVCVWPKREHSTRSYRRQTPPKFAADGQCGKDHQGLVCDPNSTVYKGTCCSSAGWCGNTAAHCGTGCQSGCAAPAPANPKTPRSDGRCGSDFGDATCDANGPFGGCCSASMFCGKTQDHCLVSRGCQSGCTTPTNNPASTSLAEPVMGAPTGAPPTGAISTNDNCGGNNGNTVCGNNPNGGCCSMSGWCGKTTAHCGEGCQSGPCLGPAVIQAPGPQAAPLANPGGAFRVVGQAGVPAMHAGLLPNGRVVFLDKVEDYSQVKLANGQYAYSAEYNPATNTYVGLSYKTNAFCSGGAFLPDGRFVSIGGNAPLDFIDPTVGDGFKAIRYLSRSRTDASKNGQSWSEPGNKLSTARWYASVQSMPDGSLFVCSGSLNGLDPNKPANNNPTYEVLNAQGISSGRSIPMRLLEKAQPYYMYPFIHLLKTGDLFVFVAKSSEVFNVAGNAVVKTLPDLPGKYRTYPNTGGSVLLPLRSATNYDPEIMICGGGSYQDINSPTEASCGRIKPLAAAPSWELESMNEGRGMVEGTLLPDGTVVWVNGCNVGAQGFGIASDPTREVLLYDPEKPNGQRWSRGATSGIARLYHSVALLLLDGTLMVAGSNPVEMPILKPRAGQTPSEDYVTEFRVENYTPPYLQNGKANRRPTAITLSSKTLQSNGSKFTITFNAPAGAQAARVALYHGGFVTHSLHMNHRMIFLDRTGFKTGVTAQTLTVTMPPNRNIAQPGPYVVYVTVDGVPGIGQFVSVS